MSTVAEWDNEYARLSRAASQMRTQGLSSPAGDQQRSLQQGLARLDAALNTLPIAAAELQRRRRLIQHLQNPSSVAFSLTTTRTSTFWPLSCIYPAHPSPLMLICAKRKTNVSRCTPYEWVAIAALLAPDYINKTIYPRTTRK